MILALDPSKVEKLHALIQEQIDHAGDEKRPVDELLERYRLAIQEGRVKIFVAYDSEEHPRGCLFYTKSKSRFGLIFARRVFEVEKALFDHAFALARKEIDSLSFESGYPTPWVSEEFSDYVTGIGVAKHDRAYMGLKKGRFQGPSPIPQGISIVPFSEDCIDEVTHVVFRAVDNTIDQELWPNVYGTEEAALAFHRDVISGKFGAHEPANSWVAKSGDTIVGICFTVSHGETAGIMHLAVDPDWRRQSIGRALLTRSLRNLFKSNEGLSDVMLAVTLGNPAMQLYESVGFEVLNYSSSYIWKK